jgi:hypothetical protein
MGLRLSGERRGEPERAERMATKDGKGKEGKGEKGKEEIDGLERPAIFFNSRYSEHNKI